MVGQHSWGTYCLGSAQGPLAVVHRLLVARGCPGACIGLGRSLVEDIAEGIALGGGAGRLHTAGGHHRDPQDKVPCILVGLAVVADTPSLLGYCMRQG